MVDLPEPDSPVRKITRPRPLRGGRARGQCRRHDRRREPGRHVLAPVQEVLKLTRGQVGPLRAGLDERQRPPHLGRWIVGPVTSGENWDRCRRPGLAASGARAGWLARFVYEQVCRPVRGGDHSPQRHFVARIRAARGERNRNYQGPRWQVAGGGAHRPHQGIRPHHQVGRAGHQREQQQPCLELASSVPELAYLPAVQRPAGGVADHRAVGEISPHVGWIAPEVPERAVLRLTAAGDRAAEPDQAGLRRVPSATPLRPVARPPHREPLGDVQHSEWRALGIVEQDLARIRRKRLCWHVERDRGRPGRPVGERAALGDGGHVRAGHEPGQWGERAGQQQLQIPELAFVQDQGRQAREFRRQPGGRFSGHIHLRPNGRPAHGRSESHPSHKHARACPRVHGRCRTGQALPPGARRSATAAGRGDQSSRAKRYSGLRSTYSTSSCALVSRPRDRRATSRCTARYQRGVPRWLPAWAPRT